MESIAMRSDDNVHDGLFEAAGKYEQDFMKKRALGDYCIGACPCPHSDTSSSFVIVLVEVLRPQVSEIW